MAKTAVKDKPALTETQVKELVDKIGLLKAQIAPMEEMLKTDIDKLKAMGVNLYLGNLYEVNVFDKEDNRLDMEAVRGKLTTQFITAHTISKTVRTAKVTSRKVA